MLFFVLTGLLFAQFAISDNCIPFPSYLRYCCWAIEAMLAALFILLFFRQRKRSGTGEIIRLVQEKCRFLSDDLINAWQLNSRIGVLENYGISRQLAESFSGRVAQEVSQIKPESVVDFRELYRFRSVFLSLAMLYMALFYQIRLFHK